MPIHHETYCELLLRVRQRAAERGFTFREAMHAALTTWLNDPPQADPLIPAGHDRKPRVKIPPDLIPAIRNGYTHDSPLAPYAKRWAREIGCSRSAIYNLLAGRTHVNLG